VHDGAILQAAFKAKYIEEGEEKRLEDIILNFEKFLDFGFLQYSSR